MSRLLVIATGGTLDSAYAEDEPTPDMVPTPQTSAIPAALASLGLKEGTDFDFVRLGHLDSKRVDERMLHRIAGLLEAHPGCGRVIVTHGTDTAPRNARYLAQDILPFLPDRKIVFCTAMQPLRSAAEGLNGSPRDIFRGASQTNAWDSLETSLRTLETMPPGARIVVGKDVFDPETVDKAREVEDGIVTASGWIGRVRGEPHPSRDLIPHR